MKPISCTRDWLAYADSWLSFHEPDLVFGVEQDKRASG